MTVVVASEIRAVPRLLPGELGPRWSSTGTVRHDIRPLGGHLNFMGMKSDNSSDAEADLRNLTFEEALRRLDETVQALEAGGLTLADATGTYEKGMKLARTCSEMLASAELRISQIRTAYGEQMRMLEDQEGDSAIEGPPC